MAEININDLQEYNFKNAQKGDMAENKCGDCFWFTKTASVYNIGSNIYDHYCRLHYTQELRYKNERACGDFKERDSDGRE